MVALGTARQKRGMNLGSLIQAYEGAVVKTQSGFEVDIVEDEVQGAWVGELELAYDRAIFQASTFGWMVHQGRDPLWMAITGYYSAFFAAKALTTASGTASRGVNIGSSIAGLHRIDTRPSAYPGRVTLVGQKLSRDSHRASWRMLREVLARLVAAEAFGTIGLAVISQLDASIHQPTWLSDFRNVVNYSIDVSPRAGALWASELRSVSDVPALESRIVYAAGLRDEQRIELVMLGCLALLWAVYSDYLIRASRPDRRVADWRRSLLSELPDPIRDCILGCCQDGL